MLEAYRNALFLIDFIRHPSLAQFDERLILIDPDVYFENEKEQISTFTRLFDVCSREKAVLITGSDRSGKTVIAKRLQEMFSDVESPAILISGKHIKNRDVGHVINKARTSQYGTISFPNRKFRVIVDDFDECTLPDQIKEEIVKLQCDNYLSGILVSFSNAPSVLFTSNSLPDPLVLRINPITDAKLYLLARKWASIGLPEGRVAADENVLTIFEKLQVVFDQTELEKAPYTAVTFLELLNSISATDISFSSFAACYDTLISSRLAKIDANWQHFDEAKNFLSLLAYRAYAETGTVCISRASFDNCIAIFEDQFLSSAQTLRRMAIGSFLRDDDETYSFYEEYLWFFLCARYVVKTLNTHDAQKYKCVRYSA